jgi:hypothetical protein
VFLHSWELDLLNEIIALSGQRNSDEPLVSVSMLQTLDKDKGEAFLHHKRLPSYISNMPDIDLYPGISLGKKQTPYPVNTRKARAVFDFEKFCRKNNDYVFSWLFSGRSLKEIKKDRGSEEGYYMTGGDIIEPFFTTTVPGT